MVAVGRTGHPTFRKGAPRGALPAYGHGTPSATIPLVNPRTRIIVIAAVLVALVAAFFLFRTTQAPSGSDGPVAVRDSVLTPFPPPSPAPWDLSTPEKAVDSYLRWTTFSYRMMNSDLPTATMEPTETVRVDSYIQLMRQKDKGIDQTLTSFKITFREVSGASATVRAEETWKYAYFSAADPKKALSALYTASYTTVYRLMRDKDGLWRVERVEATPKGEVK